MAEDKKSFLVYHDIKPILDKLSNEQVGILFRAMVDYSTERTEPDFGDLALELTFIPIKQQLDRNLEKWDEIKEKRTEAGRKGGLKSAEIRREANQANEANATFASSASEANEANEAKPTVKVKAKATVKVKGEGTVSDPGSDGPLSLSSFAIEYLNQKTGSDYPNNDRTVDKITRLYDLGYRKKDIQTVIDRKYAEWWSDENMRDYLRPSTLFGDKFEEYLHAPISLKLERENKQVSAQANALKKYEQKLEAIDALKEALEETNPKDNLTEWRTLKEQLAIAEDAAEKMRRNLEVS